MVRSLIVLHIVVISFSRFSVGQPLSDHRLTVEAAQMEQRILANIRPLVMNLCKRDTSSGQGHMYSEHQSAITDSIRVLTARASALERQIEKQKKDVCKALFKKVEATPNVHVFEDRCYLVGSTKETWDDAQEKCQLVGANLVSVISKDLQHFIQGIEIPDEIKRMWIGAKRTTTDGSFTWIENGLLLSDSYINWEEGQPSNHGGNEDCVVTYPTGWHDYKCSTVFIFICEL